MRVWRIGETGDDRERVLNYVAKGLEVSLDRCEWKFLDQLAPMQAGGRPRSDPGLEGHR